MSRQFTLRKPLTQINTRVTMPVTSSAFVQRVDHVGTTVPMVSKTDGGRGTYSVSKRIRPFTPDDIPQVVDLHKRVFSTNSFSSHELKAYFRRLFFENPWYDEELTSLVYLEDGGKISGFYGVVPRRMRMKGRPIRVAVSSQFMVDPSIRNRLAAVELQSAFFAGPQDLSLTDGANEASRKIWEALGGFAAFPYNVHWTRLLRPTRYFLERWKERGLNRLVQSALLPVSTVADYLATHRRDSPFYQAEPSPEEDLSWETLIEHLPKFATTKSLCPDYDERSLRWLLEQANEKQSHGKLHKALVRDGDGRIVGWYIYYLNSCGISQVLQVIATKHSIRRVLDQLFFHAWRLGAYAISGRLDPEFTMSFSAERCLFSFNGLQMLAHSRDAALREAIQQGDAFLTRLEGEWWMRLQGG